MLRIDTKTLTVERIGDDLGTTGDKWSGGGIGGDGCIYCIPAYHSRVLRIDPVTNTVSLFGPDLHNNKSLCWAGGCAGPYGCVYGTPHNADHVLKIDPFARTVSLIENPIPPELCGGKLSGAALGPYGNVWFLG